MWNVGLFKVIYIFSTLQVADSVAYLCKNVIVIGRDDQKRGLDPKISYFYVINLGKRKEKKIFPPNNIKF